MLATGCSSLKIRSRPTLVDSARVPMDAAGEFQGSDVDALRACAGMHPVSVSSVDPMKGLCGGFDL